MIIYKSKLLLLTIIILLTANCSSQKQKTKEKKQDTANEEINRKAASAGKFYTSNPAELNSKLRMLYSAAIQSQTENVVAIISPHAGYTFSGEVAASAFNQIDRKKEYENIFIIASSHYTSFSGASIYNLGNYETPLGEVKVNIPLAKELIEEFEVFTYDAEAHKSEHSLENQLPLLQFIMQKDIQIIPIVIGSQTVEVSEQIAKALKPYLNNKNLFIISSDFSHYPDYKDACVLDKTTAEAISKNSPEVLLNTLKNNESKNISNLATSLCGWTSVMSLLYMTTDDPEVEIIPLQYKNSGDVSVGDKERVVGYYAMAITKTKKETGSESTIDFDLNEKEKITLLEIARETVTTFLATNKMPVIDEERMTKNLMIHSGAFVTLNKDHNLRGCIGLFTSDIPLYKVIQEMAVAAATQDSRFPNVSSSEISDLEIEISVLTPMKKIESIDEIILGKHGIYIKKGYKSGTFLPQVATETGWTKEEFLGHCAKDKAGIGWDGWKDADIFIYEALVFSEHELLEKK